MPRPTRIGWKPVTATMSLDAANRLRIHAVLRGVEMGTILTELVTRHLDPVQVGGEDPAPKPAFVKAVQAIQQEKASHRPKKTPKVKTRPGPKEAPKEGEEITLKAEAYGWNFDRLAAALTSVGVSHGQLAKHLGLTNISPWGKTGIPPKWLPATHAFLLSKGWQPEADQRTIFDAKD